MSDQMPIDFDPRKLARRTDPDTSKAAAEQAGELRARHHRLIIEALKREHYTCKTSWEIHLLTGLDYHAVARRIKELREAGLVSASSVRRRGRTDRMATSWCYEGPRG